MNDITIDSEDYTGKVISTFECTRGVEEIILIGNMLITLTGSPDVEHAFASAKKKGKKGKPNIKSIVTVDVNTGKKIWEWSDKNTNPMPETLAAKGKRVFFQVNQSITALDLKTGK